MDDKERNLTKEEADRRYGISEYPDPWEGVIDDGIDAADYDYDSSYPSREDVLASINEWLSKNISLLNSITPL